MTLNDVEKAKFKRIPDLVWKILNEKGKSITQLEKERRTRVPGDELEQKFREHLIWHNKIELDSLIANKINVDQDKWGKDKSKNRFYKEVANVISDLREEGKIIDWNNDGRAGIWRLAELTKLEDNDDPKAKIFLVVIDARDRERFKLFKKGLDVQKHILIQNKNVKHIWSLSNTSDETWKEISKNDYVFFASDSVISHYGKITDITIDNSLSVKLWGDGLRTKSFTHFIMFDTINETSISASQFTKYIGLKRSHDLFPGLYVIEQKYHDEITNNYLKNTKKEKSKTPKPVSIPVDLDGPPGRTNGKVIRFIRDTTKSEHLKKKYQNHCQICNYRIQISPTKFYSEVHHLNPLKNGGDDNFGNMIVLCPTHHAEFDYKVIGIHEDGHSIIDKDGKIIGKLTLASDHKIHEKNIKFHLSDLTSN